MKGYKEIIQVLHIYMYVSLSSGMAHFDFSVKKTIMTDRLYVYICVRVCIYTHAESEYHEVVNI